MATSDMLDRGIKGGFEAIKQKMRQLAVEIKDLEQMEKDCIAKNKDAKRRNHGAFVKMTELTMQIGEKEEQLRKASEKLKYQQGRLHEKEGLCSRIIDWNKNIEQVPEGEIDDLEKHLKTKKDNYNVIKQKLADARQRVVSLEDTIERKELKLRDAYKREDQLRNEYEHQQTEYELKKKRDHKQFEATLRAEAKVKEMEIKYYNARRRHEASTARAGVLEAKIAKLEVICEELKRKRLAMESTLRELLSSYSRTREEPVPPKYPQAGLAVNSSSNQ